MGIKGAMTWEPGQRRWRKMFRGKLYFAACSTLGTPPTKEGSVAAANAWWRAREAELRAAEGATAPPHPHAARLAELERRKAWARANEPGEAVHLDDEIRRVRGGGEPADEGAFLAEVYRAVFGGEAPDLDRLRDLFGTGARWEGRLAASPAPDPDRTVGHHAALWLEEQLARVKAGDLSASEYDARRRSIAEFRDWLGAGSPIEAVDAARWRSWWLRLLADDRSAEVRRKGLIVVRSFATWLAEMRVIPMPPNLHGRQYRIGGGGKKVPVLPKDWSGGWSTRPPGSSRSTCC